MTCCPEETIGASPAVVKWQIVRGDTSEITILFYENDEKTFLDVDQWQYESTAYSTADESLYALDVIPVDGGVTISIPTDVSDSWVDGFGNKIPELLFDLQVTKEDNTVWTPVTGTISVIGDITRGITS